MTAVSDRTSDDDNIHVAVHRVEDLREQIPDWDDLDPVERMEAAQSVEPIREHSDHNVTTEDLQRYRVRDLNPQQTDDIEASHLAVGTSDALPSTSDSTLDNEVYRTEVTDPVNNGAELLLSTFLDSTEANDFTLREVGIVHDASNTFLNRSLIDPEEKTDAITLTIQVTLEFIAE